MTTISTYGIIGLTIFLSLAAISVHELGHACAMHACNVHIERISLLGFPLGKLPFLHWKVRLPGREEMTSIEIHPLVVGAFVRAKYDEEDDKVSYADRIFIAGAGPLASFAYAIVMHLIAIAGAVEVAHMTKWDTGSLVAYLLFGVNIQHMYFAPLLVAALVIGLIFRRFVCQYVIILIGLYMLWAVAKGFYLHPFASVGGPVSIIAGSGTIFSRQMALGMGVWVAPLIAAIISLILGMANALPLLPFDGGQIAYHYLKRVSARLADGYAGVSLLAVLILVGFAIWTDTGILLR